MALVDEYLDIWGESQERSLAPTTDRTSERSLNVPMPVLPGALQGFEGVIADYTYSANQAPPPAELRPTAPVYTAQNTPRRSVAFTPRSSAPAPAPLYDMIGARTTKAAGRPLPSPSPVADTSPPPSVDASKLPDPPPPSDDGPAPPSMTHYVPPPASTGAIINTNAGAGARGNDGVCPPCSCPSSGVSKGSILLLVGAAGVALWMGSEKFDKFRKTPA